MKAINQRESVATYIKSCLIFQLPRFMRISKYPVISPLRICWNITKFMKHMIKKPLRYC